jgi:hypothetical protein
LKLNITYKGTDKPFKISFIHLLTSYFCKQQALFWVQEYTNKQKHCHYGFVVTHFLFLLQGTDSISALILLKPLFARNKCLINADVKVPRFLVDSISTALAGSLGPPYCPKNNTQESFCSLLPIKISIWLAHFLSASLDKTS